MSYRNSRRWRGAEVLISHRHRLLIIAVAEGGVALALGEKTVDAFNAASAAPTRVVRHRSAGRA